MRKILIACLFVSTFVFSGKDPIEKNCKPVKTDFKVKQIKSVTVRKRISDSLWGLMFKALSTMTLILNDKEYDVKVGFLNGS